MVFEQCVERSSRFIRHVESRVVPLHDTKNQIEATKCKVDRHSERGGIKVAGLTRMMGSCRYFLFFVGGTNRHSGFCCKIGRNPELALK